MIRTDIPPPLCTCPYRTQDQPYVPTLDIEHIPNTNRIPPFILTQNLTKYPYLKTRVKGIQFGIDQSSFLGDIGIDDIIDFVKHHTDLSLTEVCTIIMNEIERYYLKKGQGVTKKAIAVQLLLPLFDGNQKVCEEFVEHCMIHVDQIRYFRRFAIRLYRRFFKDSVKKQSRTSYSSK